MDVNFVTIGDPFRHLCEPRNSSHVLYWLKLLYSDRLKLDSPGFELCWIAGKTIFSFELYINTQLDCVWKSPVI